MKSSVNVVVFWSRFEVRISVVALSYILRYVITLLIISLTITIVCGLGSSVGIATD